MREFFEIIDKRLKNKYRIKRVKGTVKEVITYPNTTTYIDPLSGENKTKKLDPTGCGRIIVLIDDKEVTLLNKTHEYLNVGNEVWVHYWTNYNDGYAAIKIGNSNYSTNLGTSSYPLSAPFTIDNCYGFTKKSELKKESYSYNVKTKSVSESFILPEVGDIIVAETKDTRTYYISSITMDNDESITIEQNPSTNYHNDFTVKNYKKSIDLYELRGGEAKLVTHSIETDTATYSGEIRDVVVFVTYVDGTRKINKQLSLSIDDYKRWFFRPFAIFCG